MGGWVDKQKAIKREVVEFVCFNHINKGEDKLFSGPFSKNLDLLQRKDLLVLSSGCYIVKK